MTFIKYLLLFVAFIVIVASVFLVVGQQTTPTPTSQPISQPIPQSTPTSTSNQTVNVFLVALSGTHQNAETIGCDDALVAVPRTVEAAQEPLPFALQQLLSAPEQTVTDDNRALYNAFAQSNLTVESATIVDSTAVIKLTGQLTMGGACDQPRIKEQLHATATQFNGVNDVEVTLNGRPFDEFLSNR